MIATTSFVGKAVVSRPQVARKTVSTVVRASEAAAEKPAAPEKPVWTVPVLDPNTPSPIFGGSTGGLLRKAQVREKT